MKAASKTGAKKRWLCETKAKPDKRAIGLPAFNHASKRSANKAVANRCIGCS